MELHAMCIVLFKCYLLSSGVPCYVLPSVHDCRVDCRGRTATIRRSLCHSNSRQRGMDSLSVNEVRPCASLLYYYIVQKYSSPDNRNQL